MPNAEKDFSFGFERLIRHHVRLIKTHKLAPVSLRAEFLKRSAVCSQVPIYGLSYKTRAGYHNKGEMRNRIQVYLEYKKWADLRRALKRSIGPE